VGEAVFQWKQSAACVKQTLEVLTNVATISAAEAEENAAFSDFISKELVAKGLLPKVMNKLGVGSVVRPSHSIIQHFTASEHWYNITQNVAALTSVRPQVPGSNPPTLDTKVAQEALRAGPSSTTPNDFQWLIVLTNVGVGLSAVFPADDVKIMLDVLNEVRAELPPNGCPML
jgi:hypothetical protein